MGVQVRRSGRTTRTAAFVAGAALLLAAGCSGGGSDGELQKIKVSMPVVPPNFVHAMAWVAQEEGFYEDFGLEVEIVSLDTGVTALRGAEAGSADIAAVPTPTLINAVGKGGTAKGFYTYSPKLDAQLVVTPEIESCEDLEGNVVGVDEVGGFAEVLTRKYYSSCGLRKGDVKYGNFPGAEGQAMAQGQAVSGVLHIDETDGVRQKFPKADLQVLANFWKEDPKWHYAGYAAPQRILDEKRAEMVAFTAANIKANEFMRDKANKDRVVEVAAEVTELDEDIVAKTYDTFLREDMWPKDNGYPKSMVNYTIDQQVELGTLEESNKPTYGDLVDPSIYQDARKLVDDED